MWIRSMFIRVAYYAVMLLWLLVMHGISIPRLVLVVPMRAIFHGGILCPVASAIIAIRVGVFGESVGVVMGTSGSLFAAKEATKEAAATRGLFGSGGRFGAVVDLTVFGLLRFSGGDAFLAEMVAAEGEFCERGEDEEEACRLCMLV